MIRTLAWKEVREQRNVWLAMALLAALVLGSIYALTDPVMRIDRGGEKQLALLFFAVVAACTYGVVGGAITLAGEREAGTLSFLTTLPASRSRVWRTKLLTAAILAAMFASVVCLMLMAMLHEPAAWAWIGLWLGLALLTVEALAWGMWVSAYLRNVLTAAGGAALVVTFLWMLTLGPVSSTGGTGPGLVILARIVLIPVAFAGSWQRFRVGEGKQEYGGVGPEGNGTAVLVWLAWRQGRLVVGLLSVAALGVSLLAAVSNWPSWPVVTFAIGIVCGLAVFAGEQTGAVPFLGDRRVPPGRLWAVKTGCWLFVGASLTGLIGGLEPTIFELLKSPPGGSVGQPIWFEWLFLHSFTRVHGPTLGVLIFGAVWPVYGFSIAQFTALLFRKTVVAAVVAVIVGGSVLALWLPTLIVGELGYGQLLLPPALLLLATRFAVWPWIAGRLHTVRPKLALALWALLAVAMVADGVWERIVAFSTVGPSGHVPGVRSRALR